MLFDRAFFFFSIFLLVHWQVRTATRRRPSSWPRSCTVRIAAGNHAGIQYSKLS